ncbi:MAG: MBL fold metallo-hydrolase, partial [Aquiluna sp.]
REANGGFSAIEELTQVPGIGSNWIVVVAKTLAPMPLVRLHFVDGPFGILLAALFVIAISLFYLAKTPALRLGAGASMSGLLILALAWVGTDFFRSQTFAGDWQLFFCDVGQGDAALVRSQKMTMLIDLGPTSESLASCLEAAEVKQLDRVILSHFDADHVGGVLALEKVSFGEIVFLAFKMTGPWLS